MTRRLDMVCQPVNGKVSIQHQTFDELQFRQIKEQHINEGVSVGSLVIYKTITKTTLRNPVDYTYNIEVTLGILYR